MNLKMMSIVSMCVALALAISAQVSAMTPDEALTMLQEGNARYVAGKSIHPRQDAGRRAETSDMGQYPQTTILACSDSRVPVEILFDQGLGDLFVVRVAGNVADVDEVGTIEYGVEHLHTPLVVVLGHTHCGAVTAVVEGTQVHGNIMLLVDNIVPAVEKVRAERPDLSGDDLVSATVEANVWKAIEDLLKSSRATAKLVQGGNLKVVGAVYDIETGEVEWLGEHPDQDALLIAAASSRIVRNAGSEVVQDDESAIVPETNEAGTSGDSKEEGSGGLLLLASFLALIGLVFLLKRLVLSD
ncbi:MAG: carbonic anhydrase [Deltaproteobacteria bacterium]|nr:carbonic anhydrase [Deltaproteobacteria bacterium]